MSHPLVVDITIDGVTKRAEGTCFRTLMASIDEDPWDHSRLITKWEWRRNYDGWKPEHQPEEPKKKLRISSKRLGKLEDKLEKWKQQ